MFIALPKLVLVAYAADQRQCDHHRQLEEAFSRQKLYQSKIETYIYEIVAYN